MSHSALTSRALPALIAGAVLIGLAPIFVRLAAVGPTSAAFWRLALALPVLGLLLWRLRPEPQARALASGHLPWLWLAGLCFAADLVLWHQALRYTSVANATLLSNVAPVFVALAAWLIFRERSGGRFVIGLLLAMAGAALLVADSLEIGVETVVGDLLGIASAVFYAGYLLTVSRQRRWFTTVQVMFWSTLVGALVTAPLALLQGETLLPPDQHAWLMLAGLALLSHVGGQGLIAYALAHLPATFSSVSLLVQPVAAALFAWVLLGERFGLQQAVGGAIVLGGILLCRLSMQPTAKPGPG
ncbi:MAG TPA: DMT family transporter [Fontimonas sp.]